MTTVCVSIEVGVPVTAPVDEFNASPVGKLPLNEYVISAELVAVSIMAVAVTVSLYGKFLTAETKVLSINLIVLAGFAFMAKV